MRIDLNHVKQIVFAMVTVAVVGCVTAEAGEPRHGEDGAIFTSISSIFSSVVDRTFTVSSITEATSADLLLDPQVNRKEIQAYFDKKDSKNAIFDSVQLRIANPSKLSREAIVDLTPKISTCLTVAAIKDKYGEGFVQLGALHAKPMYWYENYSISHVILGFRFDGTFGSPGCVKEIVINSFVRGSGTGIKSGAKEVPEGHFASGADEQAVESQGPD